MSAGEGPLLIGLSTPDDERREAGLRFLFRDVIWDIRLSTTRLRVYRLTGLRLSGFQPMALVLERPLGGWEEALEMYNRIHDNPLPLLTETLL